VTRRPEKFPWGPGWPNPQNPDPSKTLDISPDHDEVLESDFSWFSENFGTSRLLTYGQINLTGKNYESGCTYARLTDVSHNIGKVHQLLSERWISEQPTCIFSIHGSSVKLASGKGTVLL